MESSTPSVARLHPLLSAAAISVTVFSIAGVGALTGVLPRSFGSSQPAAMPAISASVPAPVAAVTALPETAPVLPKPVKKTVVRAATPKSEPVRMAEARSIDSRSMPPGTPVATPDYAPAAPSYAPHAPVPVAQARCVDCGTVEGVREVEQQGDGSWIGPVAGGVGGAILGKQMGKGSGKTIMTVLGAAGGAFAGREIEKRVRTKKHWEVSVRLEDGSSRTVSYETLPAWHIGERVRYVNGAIMPEQRNQG